MTATKSKSAKKEQQIANTTILVEGISAAIIPCKARKAFTKGSVSIKAGQRCFLVRSESHPDRFYVVGWNEERICWQCSCGAGCKSHSHVKSANEHVKVQVAKQKQADLVKTRVAALAAARAANDALLAKIDAEVQATIESERSAAPAEKSEQARIATLDDEQDRDESNEEARIQEMTDQCLLEHAALNGNRTVQAPAGGASAIEKRLAACCCMK